MKIAIIGKGNVGTALGFGLKRSGHEIKYGHRDLDEPVRDAAKGVTWLSWRCLTRQ